MDISANSLRNLVFLVGFCVYSVNCFIYGAPPDSCGNPVTFHTETLNETHVGQFLAQNTSTNTYRLIANRVKYHNLTFKGQKQLKSDVIRGKLLISKRKYKSR